MISDRKNTRSPLWCVVEKKIVVIKTLASIPLADSEPATTKTNTEAGKQSNSSNK